MSKTPSWEADTAEAARTREAHDPAALMHARRRLEGAPPEEVLRWAVDAFTERRLALVSAFGPGSTVLIHMLAEIAPTLPVLFIDTLHHFEETLAHVEGVRARYGLDLRVYRPALSREEIEGRLGSRPWERDLALYQEVTKVEPFRRATAELDGWITGRRRDQSPTRARLQVIEPGEQVRVNPLACWTRERVWGFVRSHGLPYNPLHDRGYSSIGDAPLSHPVTPGEHERAGRWRGTGRLECGIHQKDEHTHQTKEEPMAAQKTSIEQRGYAHPEALVSTEWVAAHLEDPSVRIVESDEDVLLYDVGHVPGAVKVDWHADLNNSVERDYVEAPQFAALMERLGIGPDTLVVFYGDKNNWWAAYALWVFRLFGHDKVRVMDGGRKKWEDEGRPMTTEIPRYPAAKYPVPERRDEPIRAFREDVLRHLQIRGPLVDVRSPEEYRGEKLHMPDYPQEGAMRGGHIPGARSVPWARAVDPDTGEFRTADELRKIYQEEQGLSPDDDVIAYCRIGERSSHTWFVLTYLLGFDQVRNYDGSWTEWGNSVRVPIER
jgi:thiosulfate/3-mercaptopyruvate sulfurtransferase